MTRPASKPNGFTLIELLIVVVILSTLAAIVVPQFASSSDSAKLAAAKSSLAGIRSALAMYNTEHGGYPPNAPTYCSAIVVADRGTDDAGKLLDSLKFYSNGAGEVCNTNTSHPFGPYLRARVFPDNPLVNSNVVKLSAASTLGVSSSTAGGAWLYQTATGEFIIDDTVDNRDKL